MKLIIINGTMGIGKSTTCNELLKMLDKSVYLDGDWCWKMNPFIVNEDTKKLVIDNITYILKNYLKSNHFEYVIFCWVIHKEAILNEILSKLKDIEFLLYKFTLISSETELIKRLKKDILQNKRDADVIRRSLDRLKCYENMDTIKIDVTNINPKTTAEKIITIMEKENDL